MKAMYWQLGKEDTLKCKPQKHIVAKKNLGLNGREDLQ